MEAREYSDKDIINGTRTEYNKARTQERWFIVIPGGEKLTGNWRAIGSRGAGVQWCQDVKAALSARTEKAQPTPVDPERERKIMESRKGLEEPSSSGVKLPSSTAQSNAPKEGSADAPVPEPQSVEIDGQEVQIADPDGFVRRQVAIGEQRLDHAQRMLGIAEKEHHDAVRNLNRWTGVAGSLGIDLNEERDADESDQTSEDVHEPDGSGAGPGSDTGDLRPSRPNRRRTRRGGRGRKKPGKRQGDAE